MLGVHDVSQDKKYAVMLVSLLVRAGRKWDADPLIKKRVARAEDWLRRYDAKHPRRMLRDSAILSDGKSEASD
jgi:hypothetical protein